MEGGRRNCSVDIAKMLSGSTQIFENGGLGGVLKDNRTRQNATRKSNRVSCSPLLSSRKKI